MTKEELEKEAYLFAKNSKDVQNFECGFDIAFKSYLAGAGPREKRIAELEKENAELKAFKEKCKFNVNDIFKEIETENKFTKAKEIIKKFSEFVNNEIEYDPEHPQEHTDLWNKLCEESEEFLKENEK